MNSNLKHHRTDLSWKTSNEYFELAQQLVESFGSSEAVGRTIVNRCYYSAYLRSRYWLKIHVTNDKNIDQILRKHDQTCILMKKVDSGLGTELEIMMKRRNEADYQFPLTNLAETLNNKKNCKRIL